MNFKFLTEVGYHYSDETTVQLEHNGQPLRKVVLLSLVAPLLQAKTNYEKLNHSLHGKLTPTMQARTAAYLKNANPNAKQAATAQEVAAAKAVYDAALLHFQNQGGVLTPEGHLDWAASDRLVVYDTTAQQQQLTKVRFVGGKFCTDDAGTLFDTSKMSTVFSKLGFAIYVMSAQGNLHVQNHAIGYKHHSSLLAAANAAGAGELKVHQGVLKWISNKSGHYLPSLPHFIQTLHLLQKRGIDLTSVGVQFFTETSRNNYATVADFLATLKPEEDYQHAKLIAYCNSYPYAQVETLLNNNGWRFPTGYEYTTQNRKGIIDINTNMIVPHKLVCQYLKAQGLQCNPNVYTKLLQSGFGR